jgi:hypothetical protein
MEPIPNCPTCGAVLDLTRRNAVTSVIYRHMMCRGCGVICILEGPERNATTGLLRPPQCRDDVQRQADPEGRHAAKTHPRT